MKKILTLPIVILAMVQVLNAQTNPALLTNFKVDEDPVTGHKLSWAIANNEVVNKFDLQKSTNGKDFATIAVLTPSQKTGAETYAYSELNTQSSKVMYRLKMVSRGMDVYYSNIIMITTKTITEKQFSILGNPVSDKLNLRFHESSKQPLDLRVYNVTGKIMLDLKLNKAEKNNVVTIPISSSNAPGIYIVEMNNGIEKMTATFVKQ
jgi:hypothetical protein